MASYSSMFRFRSSSVQRLLPIPRMMRSTIEPLTIVSQSHRSFHDMKKEMVLQAPPKDPEAQKRIEQRWQDEQTRLRSEAGEITRSFFRTCIRCIKLFRAGNERDEAEFSKREEEEKLGLGDSFEPPVDRENELRSRAEYYHAYTREEIEQESDCLDDDFWMEENVERYVNYIKKGEEKRKWLMKDYEFVDPFENRFDYDGVDRFEKRANELVVEMYRAKGWPLKGDEVVDDPDDEDDDWDHVDIDDDDWDHVDINGQFQKTNEDDYEKDRNR